MKYKHYEALATAIIMAARQDYVKAKNQLEKHPEYMLPRKTIRECETFFRSEWFQTLAKISGNLVNFKMDNIEDYEKRIKKKKNIHESDSG